VIDNWLATQAEEHFGGDSTVTLFKLRQFGEVLAQRAAAKVGLFIGTKEGQRNSSTGSGSGA
jgi:type I restriction enzyme R subunit